METKTKTDCRHYRCDKCGKRPRRWCAILTELYCEYEKCNWYAKNVEVDDDKG